MSFNNGYENNNKHQPEQKQDSSGGKKTSFPRFKRTGKSSFSLTCDILKFLLEVAFFLIGHILGVVIRIAWPVLKFYGMWFALPELASFTWIFFCCVGLAVYILPASENSFWIIAIPMMLLTVLFIPYYIILAAKRIKKELTDQDVLRYYWQWFLRGPLAYKLMKADGLIGKGPNSPNPHNNDL